MPRARDEKKKKSQERAVAFFQDVVHKGRSFFCTAGLDALKLPPLACPSTTCKTRQKLADVDDLYTQIQNHDWLVLACLTCLKYAEKHHYLVIHPL